MGNLPMADAARACSQRAPISRFYSSAAWVDGRADSQLQHTAGLPGVQRVAAFPDLHPGKYGPVGCAVLADRLYPLLIGNDIGCGMALFALELPSHKLRIDKAARALRALEGAWTGEAVARLQQAELPADFAEALGTLGGGNHFCELQVVEDSDTEQLPRGQLLLWVHSGSRGLGHAVLQRFAEAAAGGLEAHSATAQAYLQAHDQAVRWARLNRQIIAERAAHALGSTLQPLLDNPHNLLQARTDGWLHRKGAACRDALVPLAGSRATLSYVLAPGQADTLDSLAHGAGRKYDRQAMRRRIRASKSTLQQLQQTRLGSQVICEDRDLLIEEAPQAYKNAAQVVEELTQQGAAQRVASLRPLVTFKKARRSA